MDTPSLTSETKRAGLRRGAWTEEEDSRLRHCMETYGMMKWCYVPAMAGLNRCRKSCRLRWLNYLSPNLKRGRFEEDEDDLIIRLHKLLGNRWSLIAGRLPGRTANDIKNHWNSHLSKKNISKEKREGSNNNFKVVRPQPQTMSPGWSWPRHQLVFAGRKQEKPQASSSSPSSSNNKATVANIKLISKDVDNDLLDWENLMTEVFPDDDSREEDARGIKDDEFFMPANRDWADFIVDLDF